MEVTDASVGMAVESKTPAAFFRVFYLSKDFPQYLWFSGHYSNSLQAEYFDTSESILDALVDFPADVIIAHVDSGGWELLDIIRGSLSLGNIPFILLADNLSEEMIQKARLKRADDIFSVRFDSGDLIVRLRYFKKRQWYVANKASEKIGVRQNHTPFWKRAIDVFSTGMALLLLLPVLAIVALLIKLDSKGPVFYKSKRVGSGYKIFDLYKFRTMRTDADQMIRKMAALSMYNKDSEPALQIENKGLCDECKQGNQCKSLLFLK